MAQQLRARLQEKHLLLAPGVFDALTALLAEQAGFEAPCLSGASIAYTRLGRPDIGLVTASEVADTLSNIRERVALPIVVDADTGLGNALNVIRTVKMLERAARYAEAGAEVLFIEALRSVEDMTRAVAQFRGKAPLLANMVEGGKTPVLPAAELEAIGYSVAIFPGGLARCLAFAAQEYFSFLKKEGTTASLRGRMLDFDGLNRTIGTPAMLQLGKRYEG